HGRGTREYMVSARGRVGHPGADARGDGGRGAQAALAPRASDAGACRHPAREALVDLVARARRRSVDRFREPRPGNASRSKARAARESAQRGGRRPNGGYPVGRRRTVSDRSRARVPGGGMNGGEALSENRELEAAASRRLGDRLHEECGVFGIWGAENAARLTYAGLYALQHRGQESAGIVATDGVEFRHHKAVGLVSDVFAGAVLDSLKGHIAIGHNRYSTQGSTLLRNAQPLVVDFREGMLALGHNGNLVNAVALRNELETQGSIFQTTSDTEVILHLIARSKATEIERMIPEALARCQGAYTLVILAGEKLIGLRDPRGFRPLCLGKRGDAHVLASETCALDMVGADFIREIAAGEMVVIDGSGVRSYPALKPKPARACVFELIYFSRPDSEVFGESVDLIRRRLGRRLAEEHPVDADIVISVPDS